MLELHDLNNINTNRSKPEQMSKKKDLELQFDEIGLTRGVSTREVDPNKKNALQKPVSGLRKLFKMKEIDLFGGLKPNQFMFLMLLGLVTGIICYAQDFLIGEGLKYKNLIAHNEELNWHLRYALWVIFNAICMVLCACIGDYLSRDAEGSCLPEMKAILAGVHLNKFLSIAALLGKFIGVTLAIVGGLSIGRYGSFVHISAILTHQMSTRIKWFHDIGRSYSIRLQMYTAAIAAGSCCAAGCPFGGTIFALELTSTFYVVNNIWFSLIASFWAFLAYKMMHQMPYIKPPLFTQFKEYEINHELIFIAILGNISARVASLFIHVLTKFIFLRAKLKQPFISNRWKWCIFCSLCISCIQFPIKQMHYPERQVWNWMFSIERIEDLPHNEVWNKPLLVFNLLIYCLLKYMFIVLSLSCPLPNGIFAPIVSFGAVFGRLYGHILAMIGEAIGIQLIQDEGLYAVVGAAAVYGSMTKTMSIAIIMFELTGQVTLLLPVCLGTAVAYLSSTGMTTSILDVLLEFKNFPFMPSLGSEDSYKLKAKDIMNKNFMYITQDAVINDIPILLKQLGDSNFPIPVVTNKTEKHILYAVLPQTLKTYLEDQASSMKFIFGFNSKREFTAYVSNPFRNYMAQNEKKFKFDAKKFVDPQTLDETQEPDQFQKQKIEMVKSFWNTPIDFKNPIIIKNLSPTLLTDDAPLSKIHFLFTMLNVNVIFVAKRGKMKGIITKLDFINKRKVQKAQMKLLDQKVKQSEDELKEYTRVARQYEEYQHFFLGHGIRKSYIGDRTPRKSEINSGKNSFIGTRKSFLGFTYNK